MVNRYGRPPLFPCQIVGALSNSSTMRFSRTLLKANATTLLNPFENRRLSWNSSEFTLTLPSGRLEYVRLLMCGKDRSSRFRWMVGEVKKVLPVRRLYKVGLDCLRDAKFEMLNGLATLAVRKVLAAVFRSLLPFQYSSGR